MAPTSKLWQTIWLLLCYTFLANLADAVNNGLALTPQMGWNTWNAFKCNVSEALLLNMAERMVTLGLKDVGYNYLVLDDCWSGGRDKNGALFEDSTKFPNGMKDVSDNLHDMGLLFGIYSSAGSLTCAGYPGSLDKEAQDAKTWASWGVDYLKYDNCYSEGRFGNPLISYNRYKAMWTAINDTGRPILYSLCNWGQDTSYHWAKTISNSWRISGDIGDSFSKPDDLCACVDYTNPACIAPGKMCSILNILNRLAPYADSGRLGAWNDLDMLEVGNGGMSDDEYKAHFTLWAVVGSPLIMGNDLVHLSSSALTILNNPAIIAISKDPLGITAIRRRHDTDSSITKDAYGIGETQVWSRQLWGGEWCVVLFNAADTDLEISVTMDEVFWTETGIAPEVEMSWELWNLWSKRMDDFAAQSIVDAGSEEEAGRILRSVGWWNASDITYENGIKSGDARLMGGEVGVIEPHSSITSFVKKHSVEAFRLRPRGGSQAWGERGWEEVAMRRSRRY